MYTQNLTTYIVHQPQINGLEAQNWSIPNYKQGIACHNEMAESKT